MLYLFGFFTVLWRTWTLELLGKPPELLEVLKFSFEAKFQNPNQVHIMSGQNSYIFQIISNLKTWFKELCGPVLDTSGNCELRWWWCHTELYKCIQVNITALTPSLSLTWTFVGVRRRNHTFFFPLIVVGIWRNVDPHTPPGTRSRWEFEFVPSLQRYNKFVRKSLFI